MRNQITVRKSVFFLVTSFCCSLAIGANAQFAVYSPKTAVKNKIATYKDFKNFTAKFNHKVHALRGKSKRVITLAQKFQMLENGAVAQVVKQDVAEYAVKKGYKLRIAYNIDHGVSKSIAALKSKSTIYYLNPFGKIISAAKTKKEAIALAQKEQTVYFAANNETLQQTITRWGKEDGYKVVWRADRDYVLQFGYSFFGQLTVTNGELDKILAAFKDMPYPLKASVMDNRVILVENNSYAPSIVSFN